MITPRRRISNCNFNSNIAYYCYGGGINVYYNSMANISNCGFASNSADYYGGGIYNDASSVLTISNCSFDQNSSNDNYGGEGGGIYNGLAANIETCSFTSNNAAAGGGIYNESSSTATIDSCTFTSNTAETGDGGGIYNNSSSTLTISYCTFESNSANYGSYGGGGIYCGNSSYSSIESCVFNLNNANSCSYGGGGIFNDTASISLISSCAFTSNWADTYGGGIYSYSSSTSTISNCFFTSNGATFGGGIYSYFPSGSNILGCAFTLNSGGGIANSVSSPTISSCTFELNSAGEGGGIYDENQSDPTISSCDFISNSAEAGGGIYNISTCYPTISNCTFNSNSASNSSYGGGGIYNDNSFPTISNSVFTLNRTGGGTGGGIYNTDSSTSTIGNCTLTLNSASDGGGIYNDSSSILNIINSIIYGNSAANIHDDNSSSSNVTYSCIPDGYIGLTGNITADPLFVNGVHLASNSPCVNSGEGQAEDYGLSYNEHYGTNPLLAYGDSGQVNMGYHYYGYTGSEDAITDFTAPTVDVISPEGGEALIGGSSYDITWEASDNEGLIDYPISISYSIDGGANYSYLITADAANTGRYTWTVPNISTTEARIKITAIDTSGNSGYGESAGVFSISRASAYWYVDAASPEAGADGSAEHPFKTINAAENNVGMSYGDEIHVRQGTYYLYSSDSGPGTGPQTITLYDGIYLRGGYDDGWNQVNDPALTIISGEGQVRCMIGNSLGSATTIESFTIRDGYYNGHLLPGGGGLILYNNSSPTISNCNFIANRALNVGGAIWISGATPIIKNCAFISNSASTNGGGAIYNDNYGLPSPFIFNCAFISNNAGGSNGGAIYDYNGTPTIEGCTFTSNIAGSGGGIYNESSSPIILNSIVYGNTGGNIYDNGGSSNVTYTCIPDGYIGMTGNITADPKLVNPSAGDVHLPNNSPCVNTGTGEASDTWSWMAARLRDQPGQVPRRRWDSEHGIPLLWLHQL